MRFEWDDAKNLADIRKHGIDLADVIDIFSHPMLVMLDDRQDDGEERWIAIGWMQALIGVVVYTERQGDVIRIISARKGTKNEVRRYEKNLQD